MVPGVGKGAGTGRCVLWTLCAVTAGMPRHGRLSLVVWVGLLVPFGFFAGHRVGGVGFQIRGKGANFGAGSEVTLGSLRWVVLH